MSSIQAELGNVEYIYLRFLDCNQVLAGGVGVGGNTFEWNLPTLPQRESSTMFLQVASLTLHYEGTGAAGSPSPQVLVYNNMFADNMFSSDKSTILATVLSRDDATGHYEAGSDSPIIQTSSNLQKVSFTILDTTGVTTHNIGLTGSISILLKVIRPQHNVVRDNLVKSYVPSEVGMPRYSLY